MQCKDSSIFNKGEIMAGVKGQSSGGHNKKTQREKELLGVDPRRLENNSPDFVAGKVVAFDGLGDVGKAIFGLYEPMLHNNGTLSPTDSLAFHILCERYQEWYEYATRCHKDGRMLPIKNDAGRIISLSIAPWAKIETQLLDQLIKLCREFGLTPLSRSSVDKVQRGLDIKPMKSIT